MEENQNYQKIHQIYVTHVKYNERNSMATSIFRMLVEETHPIADNDDCILQIPKNTVIFDSTIFDRND